MRDPRVRQFKHRREASVRSRIARRAIIAAALLVSPPVLGDNGANSTIRLAPKAGASVQWVSPSENGSAQRNPFVKSAPKPIHSETVRLASGNESSIRLRETGGAIGLVPIGTQPRQIRPPAIKIETPEPPRVQQNPLIRSHHSQNSELVMTDVRITGDGNLPEPPKTNPHAVPAVTVAPLPPAAAMPVLAPIAATPAPMPTGPTTKATAARENQVRVAAPTAAANEQGGVSTIPLVEQSPPADDNPISFSMSDDSEELVAPERVVQTPVETKPEPKLAELPTEAPEPPEPTASKNPDAPVVGSTVNMAEAVDLQPLDLNEAPDIQEADEEVASRLPMPIVVGPVEAVTDEPGIKRYRPPVAVGAPPLAFAQKEKAAPTVEAAVAPTLSQKKKAGKSRVAATKLHMTLAQVRSLTVGGQLRRVDVANQDVCQAIATGPNELKLIGTGNGVTRLVVWADSQSKAPTRVRTFEIHVEDAVETNGDSVIMKSRMLQTSIAQAFPNATIRISQHQNSLAVTGECDSEAEARKIIRMVRKTCLIPVRDEIKVR